MIGIFNHRANKGKVLSRNGEYVIDTIVSSAKITEEFNGNYGLDFVVEIIPNYPREMYELFENESIIKATDETGEQIFRICKVEKHITHMNIYCRHITIQDLINYFCEDVRPTERNGQGALNELDKLSVCNIKNIEFKSDIETVSTAYYVNKNMHQVIFDDENAFLKRWGGEIRRDKYTMYINSSIGVDKGTTIRSKKNLTGFEMYADIDSLATRIYPIGFDGITIKEKYIDSPLINNYARIYPITLKFDDIKVKKPVEEGQEPSEEDKDAFDTLEQAQAELIKRTKEYFKVNKVDEIGYSYKLQFEMLAKTEEYKHFKVVETVNIGDTVTVYEESLGVNIKARVVKREYDLLKRERISTDLSNCREVPKPPTTKSVLDKVNSLPKANEILEQSNAYTNRLMNEGLSNSNVIMRRDELLVLIDSKDIKTAKKLFKWDLNGLRYANNGYTGNYTTLINKDGELFNNKGHINNSTNTATIDVHGMANSNYIVSITPYDGNHYYVSSKKTDGFIVTSSGTNCNFDYIILR